MKRNVSKWNKKYELPRVHDIRSIYAAKQGEDLNVRMFQIYQWIMVNDTSSLALVSALSLVWFLFYPECLLRLDED